MNSKLVKAIATQIVDVVERAGGPVTLTVIEQQVCGFAETAGAPSKDYLVGDDSDEVVLWNGMTDEGCKALRGVLREGRVALQQCSPIVYLAEGHPVPSEPNWLPVALAPVSTSNLQIGARFFSLSPPVAEQVIAMASNSSGGGDLRRLQPEKDLRQLQLEKPSF